MNRSKRILVAAGLVALLGLGIGGSMASAAGDPARPVSSVGNYALTCNFNLCHGALRLNADGSATMDEASPNPSTGFWLSDHNEIVLSFQTGLWAGHIAAGHQNPRTGKIATAKKLGPIRNGPGFSSNIGAGGYGFVAIKTP